jgi:hypothetical protein
MLKLISKLINKIFSLSLGSIIKLIYNILTKNKTVKSLALLFKWLSIIFTILYLIRDTKYLTFLPPLYFMDVYFGYITFFKPKRKSRRIQQVIITDMKFIHDNKQLVFVLDNPGLLSHKAVVRSIFKALKANKDFKAFGRRKTMIIQALIDGQDRSFHENVLINNRTSFKKY